MVEAGEQREGDSKDIKGNKWDCEILPQDYPLLLFILALSSDWSTANENKCNSDQRFPLATSFYYFLQATLYFPLASYASASNAVNYFFYSLSCSILFLRSAAPLSPLTYASSMDNSPEGRRGRVNEKLRVGRSDLRLRAVRTKLVASYRLFLKCIPVFPSTVRFYPTHKTGHRFSPTIPTYDSKHVYVSAKL